MNKNKFKEMKQSIFIDTDGDWETIANEISKERDELKVQLEEAQSHQKENIRIDPSKCKNWMYSDRSSFELGNIESLAEDIKKNGQLQPVIVRRINSIDFDYEVIAGERRWRACKLAGVLMEAIITNKDDTGCIVIQTSENKKKSLSYYSLSKVYLRLMNDKKISQNQMAKELSIPSSTFKDILAFTRVPQEIWDAVQDMRKIKPRTAAFIAKESMKGQEYVSALVRIANKIKEGCGVDTLEKYLCKHLSNKKTNNNTSYSHENEKGELLFRISTSGRITLSKIITAQYDISKLGEILKSAFELN